MSSSHIASAPLPAEVRELLRERIKNNDFALPVLDSSVVQIIGLCNDPDSDLEKLLRLLLQDQSLAAHLLRIANTAIYASREPIVSLNQAVARLGMSKIREIALVIASQSSQFELPNFEKDLIELRELGLAGALFGQEIARARRLNVEEHFLCGLLRNVGMPVALKLLIECYQALSIETQGSIIRQTAREVHHQLGSALISHWKLPERVGEVIRYLNQSDRAPSASGPANATRLADAMAEWLINNDYDGDADRSALHQHPCLLALNLYPDELDAILDLSADVTTAMEGMRL